MTQDEFAELSKELVTSLRGEHHVETQIRSMYDESLQGSGLTDGERGDIVDVLMHRTMSDRGQSNSYFKDTLGLVKNIEDRSHTQIYTDIVTAIGLELF